METKGLGSCYLILISLCYNTRTIMQTILLSNEFGSIEVESLGARLVSYVPSSEREVFARLSDGTGGMPICWPWFASGGPEGCRRHGLARYHDFMVFRRFESTRVSEVEWVLRSAADMREEFAYDFQLFVRYRLTDELTILMTGENSDTRPFSVNEMFHPYFHVGEVEDCRVTGVGDCLIGAGSRLFDLPKDSPHHYSLVDAGLGRKLKFSSSGDRTVVIWNPGDNVAGSMSMTSTLEPGEWRQFVCIENGTARKEFGYVLRPGERHTLTRTIRVMHLHP